MITHRTEQSLAECRSTASQSGVGDINGGTAAKLPSNRIRFACRGNLAAELV